MQEPGAGHDQAAANKRYGCSFVVLAAFVLGSGLCALALVLWLTHKSEEPLETVSVLRPTASVIGSIKELARLETTSFHIERVIDLRDRQNHLFGLVASEDAILLVAAGDVTAGVDLSLLRPEDVQVDDVAHRVSIVLPPPRVFTASLDNRATYVHTRRTDALAKRQETLETRARQEAEQSLHDAALAGGILQRAKDGAERTLRGLLASLGYTIVELSFRVE
jgi:Protein of unknown function (DUF4230)